MIKETFVIVIATLVINAVHVYDIVQGLFDGGKYLVAVRNIHFHRHGAAAGLVDFGGDRFGGGVVIIGNGHGKSILHQTKGDSFTNPLAGAGNKCDFFHFPFLIVMTYRI